MIDGGLRQLFREHLPAVHWQSIETGGTGRGVPDSNGCYRGAEFWVEFKQTKGWTVDLRPEQIGWLSRRARAGGRVFVAVRRQAKASKRQAPMDTLWILDGRYAPHIRELGLKGVGRGAVLGEYQGGPSQWLWTSVLATLIGGDG